MSPSGAPNRWYRWCQHRCRARTKTRGARFQTRGVHHRTTRHGASGMPIIQAFMPKEHTTHTHKAAPRSFARTGSTMPCCIQPGCGLWTGLRQQAERMNTVYGHKPYDRLPDARKMTSLTTGKALAKRAPHVHALSHDCSDNPWAMP